MCEWSETRTIACLKLRAGQKIVNARLELKGLSGGRASRIAKGKQARGRLIIEVGREVSLNAEMLTEVTDNRCLESRFRRVVCWHTAIRRQANTATVGTRDFVRFSLGVLFH